MEIKLIVSVIVIFICLLLMLGFVILFLKDVVRKQANRIKEQEDTISHQAKIINRLMPKNPCQMVIAGLDIKCMNPSSHVYGGVQICKECAHKLIENGANPPPVEFNFKE